MKQKIRIGILGYGNIGKAVEASVKESEDLELEAIFTRRNPNDVSSKSKLLHISEVTKYINKIDVMILCGGSATDLPHQTLEMAKYFNVVDSFDTHARIEEHFEGADKISRENKKISLISIGWDPGLFSLNRLLGQTIMPEGKGYTFWGKGVSQGHSDAIRRVEGVKLGIQYTVPIEETIEKVRSGERQEFKASEMHKRVCYIVPKPDADLKYIENTIKNMPNYFSDYNTTINFISEEEFKKNHVGMPHGGFVIHSGKCVNNTNATIEFKLNLESNPAFTGSILTAYARAVYRLYNEGKVGAYTIFDIPLSYLSPKEGEELRREIL